MISSTISSFSLYTKGREFSKASDIHLPECSPMVCPEFWGVFTMAVEDIPNKAKKAKLSIILKMHFSTTLHILQNINHIYIRHYSNLQHHGAIPHGIDFNLLICFHIGQVQHYRPFSSCAPEEQQLITKKGKGKVTRMSRKDRDIG